MTNYPPQEGNIIIFVSRCLFVCLWDLEQDYAKSSEVIFIKYRRLVTTLMGRTYHQILRFIHPTQNRHPFLIFIAVFFRKFVSPIVARWRLRITYRSCMSLAVVCGLLAARSCFWKMNLVPIMMSCYVFPPTRYREVTLNSSWINCYENYTR